MRKFILVGGCIAIAFLLLLSGSAGLGSGERGALRLCWGGEPESFDPAVVSGLLESWYVGALFEGLVSFERDGKTHAPGIARSWTISDDGLVYTFNLRPSLWSDGAPLTAHDFVYSWRRALDPRNGGSYAEMLFHLKNGERFHLGKVPFEEVGVRATDDATLEVTLNNPTPFFLDIAAFMTLLPVDRRCIEQWGDDWVKPGKMTNNGPYLLESWRPNYKIVLKKNPRYWDAAHVVLERVECFVIESPTTALNAYETGMVDWLDGGAVPVDFIEILRPRSDFTTYTAISTAFLRFNVTKPPFNDPRVRKAFAMAIRKPEITERILRAGEVPADVLVPPGFSGYRSPEGLKHDPAAAQRLLREAYPDIGKFPKVEFLTVNRRKAIDLFEVLQKQWEDALGVRVEPKIQEWKVYLSSLRELEYHIGSGRWIGDYVDPATFIELFTTTSGNNRTGWSSPEYDRLVAEAARERDRTKRLDLLQLCERMILEEETIIAPLNFNSGFFLRRAKVTGTAPNLQQRILLKHYRISD
ncbi:MAG: hypothetical protein A2Z34_08695 [Planctomycetes bacterium RBG_16_59_8]|nr:MAG: hypothetical protein A2Z34_08695 [Planctomycetes bacterium RBG_16_59_8]